MGEPQWTHASWVVMGMPVDGRSTDTPLATRPSLDEALTAMADLIRTRLRQGYGYRGCAMYICPSEEMIEVKS